ncbi:hypothetical protein E8E13_006065 [Curvularia kusanoi]|uniref:Rhodopsin domain-containing protein n=1 Tax=Curvularia kusanoi TaxID=90978 RepID=A0A9P4T6U1_CURKU|nr:hypothetical protein E8E13_006065 [Curvularia kusanoi]
MVNKGLQPVNLVLAILPGVICVPIVSVRIWMRLRQQLLGVEDILLLLATALNLVLSFTTSGYIVTSYYGYHIYDIPKDVINQVVVKKWNYANSCIYNPILALVKVSFLWTLIKLRSPNKWINWCLWVTLIINGCFAIAAPLACMLQCNPIPRYWDTSINGSCVDRGAYVTSTSSIVLATDVLILLMPTWILHDLRMPFARKMMVIAFLSFGIAVTIVGAVRTSVLIKVFVIGYRKPDPTYEISYTLSNIESALAIMGTCGPTIKHLFGLCIPVFRAKDGTNDRDYSYPPTIGSRNAGRKRHRTQRMDTTNGNDKDFDCRNSKDLFGKDRSGDDVELARVDRGGESDRRSTTSDEHLVITKTVAWKIEASEKDFESTQDQRVNIPHTVL